MEILHICTKIFLIALPFAAKSVSPISYINIEISENLKFSNDDFWNTFNRLRWDTDLSCADLSITRIPDSSENPSKIKVASLSTFEDDEGNSPKIEINQFVEY